MDSKAPMTSLADMTRPELYAKIEELQKSLLALVSLSSLPAGEAKITDDGKHDMPMASCPSCKRTDDLRIDGHDVGDRSTGLYAVVCEKCGVRGPQSYRIEDVANRWNRVFASLLPTPAPGYEQGIEDAVKAILKHKPDASFDDSMAGAFAITALLTNVAAEVSALLPSVSPVREGDGN